MNGIIPIAAQYLSADVEALNIMSENIANLNTPGYRAEHLVPSFQGVLHAASGTGSVAVNLSNGPLIQTGRAFDLALQGRGFFVVDAGGKTLLERAGQFSRDAQGHLVDAHGYSVLGVDGVLSVSKGTLRVLSNGTITQGTKTIGRLKIIDVIEPRSLQPIGGGLFAYVGPTRISNSVVHQDSLEGANVNLANTMVQLIALTRHAQSVQRGLLAYDQAMDTGVTQLGKNF